MESNESSVKPEQSRTTKYEIRGIQSSFADLVTVMEPTQQIQQTPTSSAQFISTGPNGQLPMVYLPSQQINLTQHLQNKTAGSSGNPLNPSTKILQAVDPTPNVVTIESSQHQSLVQLSSQEIRNLQHRILGNTVRPQIPDSANSGYQGNTIPQANLMVHVSTQKNSEGIMRSSVKSNVGAQLPQVQMIPECPEVAPISSCNTHVELAEVSNAEKDKTNSANKFEVDPDCPKCDYFRGLSARRLAELKRLRNKVTQMEIERAQNADHTLSLSRELQDLKDNRKIPSVSTFIN